MGITQLQQSLPGTIDGLLVMSAMNRGYLTGFFGNAGALVVSKKSAALLVDSRYTERARREVGDEIAVVEYTNKSVDTLAATVQRLGITRLGIETEHITVARLDRLRKQLKGVRLVKTSGVVERLRAAKNTAELRLLKRAVKLTDETFLHIRDYVKAQYKNTLTERHVADEIERYIRTRGGDGVAFESIVAFGKNAAMPHHATGTTKIRAGNVLLLDFGAKLNGYHADLSRTLFIGKPMTRHQQIYEAVLAIQAEVIKRVQVGAWGSELDTYAKQLAADAGFPDLFTHGLGHGVGLDIHELPNLHGGKKDAQPLANGMVFTVEPGIYVSGVAGVRIEDIVALDNGKARVLTNAPKSIAEMIVV